MNSKIVCCFCWLLLVACKTKVDVELDGNWSLSHPIGANIENIVIEDGVATIIDKYENHFLGSIDGKDQKIEVTLSDGYSIDLAYQIKDTILVVSDTVFYKQKEYQPSSILINEKPELLGLNASLIFPNQPLIGAKHVTIKVKNNSSSRPFQVGGRMCVLSDILLMRRETIKEVVIFIEKGASLKDVLILEQLLSIYNNVKRFILVTDVIGLGEYKSIVDERYIVEEDKYRIYELIEEYTEEKIPAFNKSDYEIRNGEKLEEYINPYEMELFYLESPKDFELNKATFLSDDNSVLIKLSSNMSIEEYLNLLNEIQILKLLRNKPIQVHILD